MEPVDASDPVDAGQDVVVHDARGTSGDATLADSAGDDGATPADLDAGDGALLAAPDGNSPTLTCTQCVPSVLALPVAVSATNSRFPGITWYQLGVPTSIAVDADAVYWGERTPDPACIGVGNGCPLANEKCVIRKVPKGAGHPATYDPSSLPPWVPTATFNAGGPFSGGMAPPWTWVDPANPLDGSNVVTLATGPEGASPSCRIALDATGVYWADSSAIFAVGHDGGTVTAMTSLRPDQPEPVFLAANAAGIYWTDGAAVSRVGLDGTGAVALAPSAGAGELVVNSTTAYWLVNEETPCDSGGCPMTYSTAVMAIPIGGGSPTTVASLDNSYVSGLSLDASRLYWASSAGSGSSVMEWPLDGGAPAVLTTQAYTLPGTSRPADGETFYVGYGESGPLLAVPLDGGYAPSISSGLAAGALATDEASFYWIYGSPGTPAIMTLPRQGVNAGLSIPNNGLVFYPVCSAATPPPAQTFTIMNTGATAVIWSVASPYPAYAIDPDHATLAPGAAMDVSVSMGWPPNINVSEIVTGHDTLVVETNVANLPPPIVRVTLMPTGLIASWNGTVPCDVNPVTAACDPVTDDPTAGIASTVSFGNVSLDASRSWTLSYGRDVGDASTVSLVWSTDNPSFVVVPDGNDTITVTFTPTSEGMQTATVSAATVDGGGEPCGPLRQSMTGTGVAAADGGLSD